jgi:hypothetical protein
MKAAPDAQGWELGFDGHRRAQILRGLELSPAERLRWLEQTTRFMRRWQQRSQTRTPADQGR